jgi:hypothetical protein
VNFLITPWLRFGGVEDLGQTSMVPGDLLQAGVGAWEQVGEEEGVWGWI